MEKNTRKRKYCLSVLLPFILCALLLPSCKELFHPGSGSENNNNSGNNGNNSVLNVPTGLNVYISGGYFYYSWNAVSGAEWYEISVSDTPNGTYAYRATTSGTSYSEYAGTDTASGIYIKIRACSDGKESPWSAYFYLHLDSGNENVLNAPTMLNGYISGGYIYVFWNEVSGAEWYDIFISPTPNGTYTYQVTVYGTSYSEYVDMYTAFDDLYIKIRACSDGKESPLSAYIHLISGHSTIP
jgi:hypothetical protein